MVRSHFHEFTVVAIKYAIPLLKSLSKLSAEEYIHSYPFCKLVDLAYTYVYSVLQNGCRKLCCLVRGN